MTKKQPTQAQMIKALYDKFIVPQKEGELPFEVYPENLPVMTYVDAVKAVKKLGKRWRIPTLEELRLMYKHKDEIGGVITEGSGSDCPGWYWSSTEGRDNSSYVRGVRFSDGVEGWGRRDDDRWSCRPVRLVAASAPTPNDGGQHDNYNDQ
jgi:hypothetical protein